MPTYKMVVQEVYDVWYEVEGENEEEAYENYYEGNCTQVHQDYSHVVDDTLEIIENLDETDKELIEGKKKAYWDAAEKMFKFYKGDEEDIL